MKKHRFKRFLYLNYSRFSKTQKWRQEHITKSGYTLIIFLFITALMGLDINKKPSYYVFSILLSILIISIISSRIFSSKLILKRILPKYGTVNQTLVYDLKIKNLKNKKELSIFYKDKFADSLPSIEEFINIPEPNERKRNIWDRNLLYYRWLFLKKKKRNVKSRLIELPKILANQEITTKIDILPTKRGILKFKLSLLNKPDIFAMFKGAKYLLNEDEILILPQRYLLNSPNLDTKKLNSGLNTEFLSVMGNGDEFFALRDYRNGDSIKDIHWKSWAKKGKPIVKEYQEHSYFRKALILDPYSNNEDIFETAISLTASYVAPLNNKSSNIDKIFINDYSESLKNNKKQILMYLAKLQRKPDNFKFEKIKKNLKTITGAIVILNNLDSNRIQFLNYLNSLKIKTHIILVTNLNSNKGYRKIIKSHKIKIININNLETELKKLQ